MTLTEYLYIDNRRLDSYVQQISSGIVYDKVPQWQAGVSLAGPKLEGTQASFARELTSHEKVTLLLDYLTEKDLVLTQRPVGGSEVKDFAIEDCLARRFLIPPREEPPPASTGLAMWVSPGLYLLEDFPRRDEPPDTESLYSSPASVLAMLLLHLEEELRDTIVATAWHDETLDDRLLFDFAANPSDLLAELGARPGAPRAIRSLYRVRWVVRNWGARRAFAIATIGYPIFVAESSRQRNLGAEESAV